MATIVLAHSFVLHGRLRVCYEITLDQGGATRLYWGIGGVFSELHSVSRGVTSGKTEHICLQHPDFRKAQAIRIDPIDRETKFEIGHVYMERVDLLFPWQQFGRISMAMSMLAETNDAEVIADGPQRRYMAFSIDPYLVWNLNESPLPFRQVVLLNLITVTFILILGLSLVAVIRKAGVVIDWYVLYRGLLVLSLYAAYFAVAWLVVNYMDLFRYSQTVIHVSIALMFLYFFGVFANVLVKESAMNLVIFSAVALIIALDLSVRMSGSDSVLFRKPRHDPYHWNTNRVAEDNLLRSSIRYERDFREISLILEPGSRFLADVPTSYYATAAIDVYPVVANRHHRHWSVVYLDTINILCTAPEKLLDHLKAKKKELESNQLPIAKYLIMVRDQENPHINNSCMNREYQRMKEVLENRLPMVFKGTYVSVYQLKY